MNRTLRSLALAAATAVGLAACSGSNGTQPAPLPYTTGGAPSTSGSAVLGLIVGVGDSLTAGFQSGGLVGQGGANPLYPSQSPLPGVQSTQDKGWWALFYAAAKGGTASGAPYPAIKYPGLNSIEVPTAAGFPAIQSACGGLNAASFDPVQALTNRVNPSAIPLDLAVPGQTVHEALYATAPIGSCAYLNAPPPTDPFMGLGQLLAGESADIYPILGNFPGKSQVQAAVSLHPTLTTVWLGGNDLLKVLFSGGAYPAVSAQSMQADLTLIVQTLQNAGSQVALANIPNVLNTAALIAPQNVATVVGRFLVGAGVPAAVAAQYAGPFTQLVLATNNVGSGEYVTATGAGKIAAALGASLQTQTQAVPPVFVTGDTISPALAAQVQALNDSYNTTIQNVAQSTGAAFVDIRALFTASAAGVPINPPTCCDGLFGGGLFSYDGIHPSNTGYALVANAFIASIDAKFGTTIAPVSVTAAYATDPYAPH